MFSHSKLANKIVELDMKKFLNHSLVFNKLSINGLIPFFKKIIASLKSKVQRNKMITAGQPIEYRCLIHGNKTISTSVGAKEHQRFQASYSTILKAHMTALKKRERKDRKKTPEEQKDLKRTTRKV